MPRQDKARLPDCMDTRAAPSLPRPPHLGNRVIRFIRNQRLLNNVVRSPKPSTPRCSCGPAGGLLQMQNHSPTPDLLKLNLHFNTFPGRLLDGHQSGSRPGVCQTGSALVQILVLLLSCCATLGKSLHFFDLWCLHI